MKHPRPVGKATGFSRPVAEDIEPRILYSADAGAVLVATDLATPPDAAAQVEPVAQPVPAQQQQAARHLVVIDSALGDVELLIADLADQRANGQAVDWLLIDRHEDGINALSGYLQQSPARFDALHIVTHGDAGQFGLGSQTISNDTLRSRAGEIAGWSAALTENADLLIYGCDLTASEQGQSLITNLSVLTTADVAASSDTTGHAEFGGNWTLESRTGPIESTTPFSAQTVSAWRTELTVTPQAVPASQINSTTVGTQELSSDTGGRQIATNNTNVVVVWEDGDDVYYRVRTVAGADVSGARMVTNMLGYDRSDPTVAMASDGSFVIVWESDVQDGGGGGIYAQRFDALGAPKARPADAFADGNYSNNFEFRINSTAGFSNTTYPQTLPSAATRNDGGFVVTWTNDSGLGRGVRLSIFDANGLKILDQAIPYTGLEEIYSSSIAVNQTDNSMAMVVTRHATLSSGSERTVMMRIDENGSVIPGSVATWGLAGIDFNNSSVAINSSGHYAVVSHSQSGGNNNIILWAVRLNGDGSSTSTSPITVSQSPSSINDDPDVAVDDNNNVIVTWHTDQSSGTTNIYAQQFNVDGQLLGGQVLVNDHTGGEQRYTGVVSHGSVASVIWSGEGSGDPDGVYLRRVDVTSPGVEIVQLGFETTEGGGTATFDVRLDAAPAGGVQVRFTVSNGLEAEIKPSDVVLAFNTIDWAAWQTVTVTGLDDLVQDGDVAYTLDYTVTSVADPLYAALPGESFALVNRDDDTLISPVADNNPLPDSVREDEPVGTEVGITALATDGANTITYTLNPANPLFQIDPVSGIVRTAGALDFETAQTHSITVEATSSGGTASLGTFTVSVGDANEFAPVVPPGQTFNVDENAAIGTSLGNVAATDADIGDSQQNWAITGGSGAGIFGINSATGEITVINAPAPDFEAGTTTYTLVVTVQDGANTAAIPQPVSVDLNDINEAPQGGAVSISAVEDTDYIFTLGDFTFTDPDGGDNLATVTLDTLPATGILIHNSLALTATSPLPHLVSRADLLAGMLTYRPVPDASGAATATFQIRVVDVGGLRSPAYTATINIAAVNDPPMITSNGGAASSIITLNENTSPTIAATASDADADAISWSISGPDAALFTVNASTGSLNFASAPDFETPLDTDNDNDYVVRLEARDTSNAVATQIITLRVANVTESLSLTAPGTVAASEDTPLTLTGPTGLFITDGDNTTLLDMTISVDSGLISLAQTNGLTFSAGDGAANATMTFTGSSAALNAAVAALHYAPAANYVGNANLVATVSDPLDNTRQTTAAVTITISAVNDTPVVTGSRSIAVSAGQSAAVSSAVVSTSDVEDGPDTLLYTVDSPPQFGALSLDGTQLTSGAHFSQADIERGAISYQSQSTGDAIDAVGLSVTDSDGGMIGNIQINVTAIGDVANVPIPEPDTVDNLPSTEQGNEPVDAPVAQQPQDAPPSQNVLAPAADAAAESTGNSPAGDAQQDEDNANRGRHDAEKRRGAGARQYIDLSNTGYDGFRVSDGGRYEDSLRDVSIKRDPMSPDFIANYDGRDFQRSMNELRDQVFDGVVLEQRFIASSVAVSTGVSIGYVLWLLRGGALLSSLIASMPAWRSIDPLPVLGTLDAANRGGGDDDSLQGMLDKAREGADGAQAAEADSAAQNEASRKP